MKLDFNQMIDKFNQLDVKFRYLIFGSLLLIIFLLDLTTLLSAQYGALQNLNTKNEETQQNISRLKSDLQKMDQINAGLLDSRTQLEALNMKIRPIEEKSAILEDISRIANSGGVKIDQLVPQAESQQMLISKGPIKYYALPIVLQTSSGYHVFGHFLNKLEGAPLFFTISSLTMESRPNDIRHHGINATINVVLSDKNTDGVTK